MVPCGRPGRGTAANGLVLGDHAPGVLADSEARRIKLEEH